MSNHDANTMNEQKINPLADMTPEAVAMIGVGNLAYIRPSEMEGREVFVVHAADGTELGTFSTRHAAFYTARQHELEPVSVH